MGYSAVRGVIESGSEGGTTTIYGIELIETGVTIHTTGIQIHFTVYPGPES